MAIVMKTAVAPGNPKGVNKGCTRRARSSSRGVSTRAQQQQASVGLQDFSLIQSHRGDVESKAGTHTSLARHNFDEKQETALNDHINVEYTASYTYHALYAYFNRDDVGLQGFANFFKAMSAEERGHAEAFMNYQTMKGGRVALHPIQVPPMPELETDPKGDALAAMEFALAVEKFTYQKLLELHRVAEECGDPQMCDYVENEFLQEQVESIKEFSNYVSILNRIGKGFGVYYFDHDLNERAEKVLQQALGTGNQ